MLLAKRLQPWRTQFLTGFQHELHIEPEFAAFRYDGLQRRHVHRVLAFVVGGAAPVILVSLLFQRPRFDARAPLVFKAAYHIAVTVHQHCRQVGIFDALGKQNRSDAFDRVRQYLGFETHAIKRRRDLVFEIHVHVRTAFRNLTLGADGHAAREVCDELAFVKVTRGAGDGGFAGHGERFPE